MIVRIFGGSNGKKMAKICHKKWPEVAILNAIDHFGGYYSLLFMVWSLVAHDGFWN